MVIGSGARVGSSRPPAPGWGTYAGFNFEAVTGYKNITGTIEGTPILQ